MPSNPRHRIPHHTNACAEHWGCPPSCPVRTMVARYWDLFDRLMAAKKWPADTRAQLEAHYGN